jgi:hypothetical protein
VLAKSASEAKFETVAGTGTPGESRDGGSAISARLNQPFDFAFDLSGNL